MDSRYLLNEALDDPTKLQTPQNPLEHLVHSLKVLTKGFPPRKDTYTTNECHGLYSGPTSIAYLFLCISRTHPDLVISGRKPSQWASEYLQGSRDCHAASASKSGVINERLAYGAVRAAVTQDLKDVEKLAEDVNKAALTSERGSDEWLYGRAGCLYLLRLARSWVPNSDRIVDPVIHKVIKKMLAHGPAWPWHGKDYLGRSPSRLFCSVCTITSLFLLLHGHRDLHVSLYQTLYCTNDNAEEPSRSRPRPHRHHHPNHPKQPIHGLRTHAPPKPRLMPQPPDQRRQLAFINGERPQPPSAVLPRRTRLRHLFQSNPSVPPIRAPRKHRDREQAG